MACKKSINEWEDLFKASDKDGSGYLDVFELRDLLRGNDSKITESQIADVFIFLEGPNGDRKITLEEFTNGMRKLTEMVAKITELFHALDKDHSGSLDKGELSTIIKEVYPSISDADVNCIFKEADKNGDGQISLEEFLNACS